MQQYVDTKLITRDNLTPESFDQVVLDETIWLKKEYCQWKIELLWWLVRQENVSIIREQQLNLLLDRFYYESIPAYFEFILDMVVFFFNKLSETTIELAISVIKNKTISIGFDEHERLVNQAETLPNHFKIEILEILNNINPHKISHIGSQRSHIGSLGTLITHDNITILTALVSSIIGITTVTIKGIKLWVDERASRKIRIKYKDLELELQGGVSEDELRERLSIFKEIKDELNRDNVKIIISNDK